MKTRTVQLGDICEFHYGDSLKENRRQPGHVPVFGSNGIVGWHNEATTSGPTIVIGRKGSIGEINWSDVPCFPIDTTYFGEGNQAVMINYRVDDLDALLVELAAAGVWIDEKRMNESYGRFAWIKDCDGNRLELWQPLES